MIWWYLFALSSSNIPPSLHGHWWWRYQNECRFVIGGLPQYPHQVDSLWHIVYSPLSTARVINIATRHLSSANFLITSWSNFQPQASNWYHKNPFNFQYHYIDLWYSWTTALISTNWLTNKGFFHNNFGHVNSNHIPMTI